MSDLAALTDPARRLAAAGLCLMLGLGAGQAGTQDRAFPGAAGFGAVATGWRGGKLIPVTTLADTGKGSLRDCAEDGTGPRICVFRVNGTIELDSPIMVGSQVYIAGQTAPGSGIQIKLGKAGHSPLIVKNAHDVVIRFLKLRPGTGAGKGNTVDALTVENASRVYLGNLSMAFAPDETFNVHVSGAVASDITLADSLLAFSLDKANHPDGRHSKGALICSTEGRGYDCGRITLWRNIFAHHRDRNPDVKATTIGPVEVISNIFYDPISQFGEFYDLAGDASISYVGNLALAGPSTVNPPPEAVQVFDWEPGKSISVIAEQNASRHCKGGQPLTILDAEAVVHEVRNGSPLSAPVLAPDSLTEELPATVGDALPDRSHRDELDKRALRNLARCQGKVIDHPDEVKGWPDPVVREPAPDADGDGLPDDYEAANGLDPQKPDDIWAMNDGSGLSQVETWLALLAGDREATRP
ncbi:hypothetical protein [Paracoccus benzoatiresistens]|uniref:Pectate lyase n=1 Tax=Paracoccus benzoatiresistens TaxID=2997341 RepID=A0ABT4J0I7_9RHOB|nr:hypothetical protein [Paracoccus sp. EF6]MCZ0960629.1 hypothetical protein [Paracoccus sp. EF6]